MAIMAATGTSPLVRESEEIWTFVSLGVIAVVAVCNGL